MLYILIISIIVWLMSVEGMQMCFCDLNKILLFLLLLCGK